MVTNEFLPNHAEVSHSIQTHLRFSPLPWVAVALAAVILFSFLMPTAESAKREPASATVLKKNPLPGLETEPTTPSLRAALGLTSATLPTLAPIAIGEAKVVVREPSSAVPAADLATPARRAEPPQSIISAPIAVAGSGQMLAAHVSDHE